MLHILPRIEYSINSTKSPEDINAILKLLVLQKDWMEWRCSLALLFFLFLDWLLQGLAFIFREKLR